MAPVRGKPDTPSDHEPPPARRSTARLVVLGVAAVLLVWFAAANLRTVTIDFWVRQSRAPLIAVIVIAGLLGALITTLAHRFKSRRG